MDKISNTTGSFNAYTSRVKNAGGTQQSASLAFKSTSSGYSPEIHLTQRTGSGSQRSSMIINSSGNFGVGESDPDSKLTVRGHAGAPHTVLKVKSQSASS